jgi:ABC-type glycerol-3-phosphate transport system permease component
MLRDTKPDGRSDRVADTAPRRNKTKYLSRIALALFVLVYLVPVFGVLLTSLKTNAEIAARGIWAPTGSLTFDNYVSIWRDTNAGRYLLNSLLVTVPAVIISIAGGASIGYALAKLRPRFGGLIQLVVLSGLFVPPQVLLVPLFSIFSDIGLIDTLWPIILVHSAVGLSITTLVMRNFFDQIPDSLRSAAQVDGASEGYIFLRVVLPLARPSLAALATLQFLFIWNDFLYPLVFTSSDGVRTVMLGLLAVQGQFTVAFGTQAALSVIASIPTVLIFLVFQRHFVKGLLAGSIKG